MVSPALEVVAPAPTPAPSPARAHGRGWLGLGVQAGYDGATAHGNYALAARAAVGLGRLELGLSGSASWPAPVESPLAELRLAQHRLALYAGVALHESERVRLVLSASAGMVLATTRVRSELPLFAAQTGRRALAAVGAGASLLFTPGWAGGHLALACSASLEAFPERLALVYQSAGGSVRVARVARVQPLFRLELVLPLGR